jgi:hypothetical protein
VKQGFWLLEVELSPEFHDQAVEPVEEFVKQIFAGAPVTTGVAVVNIATGFAKTFTALGKVKVAVHPLALVAVSETV